MTIVYTRSTEAVDWHQLAALFVRTELGDRSPQLLQALFEGSQVTVFAHDAGRVVGAARALSDFVLWSAIFDVAVDPAYQGRRIGATLMQLLSEATGTPNAMLKSMPGKEPFYAGLGFAPMPAGMERHHDVATRD
ncbi:MAG: GNAT family N-acetyltransferase [Pseudoxanthomonas sp.]